MKKFSNFIAMFLGTVSMFAKDLQTALKETA